MAVNHYDNLSEIRLEDYISPMHFRTILPQQLELIHGFEEVITEVNLNNEFRNLLSFTVPWDGKLYAYTTLKDNLKDLQIRFGEIKKIVINDWDDKFIFILEFDNDENEQAFLVKSSEVVSLLENCLRVPEQQSWK